MPFATCTKARTACTPTARCVPAISPPTCSSTSTRPREPRLLARRSSCSNRRNRWPCSRSSPAATAIALHARETGGPSSGGTSSSTTSERCASISPSISRDSRSSIRASPAPVSETQQLLVVFHSRSGGTRALAEGVIAGASSDEVGNVEVTVRSAFDATADDVRRADGILLGTPENFGYMSGALKDFFERIYYELL